jgi:hypothetical protein
MVKNDPEREEERKEEPQEVSEEERQRQFELVKSALSRSS